MISTICKASAYLGIQCQEDGAANVEARFADHVASYGLSFATQEEY